MTDFVQISRQPKIHDADFYPMVDEMYERIWQRLMPPQLITDGLACEVKKNVVTPADAPIPDCMTCGACCAVMPCVGVRPTEIVKPELCWDVVKETELAEIVVDRYIRRNGETFACAALEIGNTSVSCTIYENRPKTCRVFEAGSDRCHALRRATGVEPFLSLDEMSTAIEKLESRPIAGNSSGSIRNAEIKCDHDTGRHTITALMKDGTIRPLHVYDPEQETYMQFEFDGLSIDAAAKLIASRAPSENTSA